MGRYSRSFYSDLESSSESSAQVLVPILIDKYQPSSVIDFGCGTGAFVRKFLESDISDVIGVEGNWILELDDIRHEKWLKVSDLNFRLELNKKVDLVLCLEVAEHLEEKNARQLIQSLTLASDRIVFSAAIPGQAGTDHINLQYPEYWADIFYENGYVLEWDPRPSIWKKKGVAPWYKQNMLVYSKQLGEDRSINYPNRLHHPEIFLNIAPFHTKTIHYVKRVLRKLKPIAVYQRKS